MAISDTIFEALREIDSYMDDRHSIYDGEARLIIDELRTHMNGVLLFLDTPPGTDDEPVLENETRK